MHSSKKNMHSSRPYFDGAIDFYCMLDDDLGNISHFDCLMPINFCQ